MNSICIELFDFLFRLPANEVAWLPSEFNWGKCCPSSKWSKDPADVKAPPVTEAVTIGGKKRRDGFISSLLLPLTDHHKPSDLARIYYLATLEVRGRTQVSPGWAKASASCMPFWKLLGRRILSLLFCVVSKAQFLALEDLGYLFPWRSIHWSWVQLLEVTSFLGLWPRSSILKGRNNKSSPSQITSLWPILPSLFSSFKD